MEVVTVALDEISLEETEKEQSRQRKSTEAEEGRERKRLSIASQCKDMKILKRIRIIKKPLVLANKKFFVALVKEIQ